MHKSGRKAPAKIMIINALGKNKTFELFINKLVFSQTRRLYNGRAFIAPIQTTQSEKIFIFIGFQAFCRIIYCVCELVHCCDALHSQRLHETTKRTSKNDGRSSFRRQTK